MKLSWHELPKTGQKVYQGDLVGPFDLALRPRIPNDVLAQVRASRKYRLEMAFSVGVQPIEFRWRLVQADLDNSTPRVEVRRGGDW